MASNSNAVKVLMKREGLTFAQADHFLNTGEKVSAEFASVAAATDREHGFTDLSGGPSEREEGQARIMSDLRSTLGDA